MFLQFLVYQGFLHKGIYILQEVFAVIYWDDCVIYIHRLYYVY